MSSLQGSGSLSVALVGRDSQLELLTERLNRASDGRGQIAIISGDAGVGKSRLIAELKAIAGQRGALVLEGRCFEEDHAFPLAPLLDLLRAFSVGRSDDELLRALGPVAAELVALSPQLAAALPDVVSAPRLEPEQEKRRLFGALTLLLQRLSGAAPLLLVFEDLHWCDSVSLEWLLSFARQQEPHPILLALTVRGDETDYDTDRVLAAVERLPLVSHIELRSCTREEIELMLRSMFQLSDAPHPEFLNALFELTGGNPFFVEEVLKALIASGDIYAEAGSWTRKPMRELRIPRSVQVAVQQRARRLSDAAQRVLSLAAVAGQRFDFVVLQTATHTSEHALLGHIKELLALHLVVEEGADSFAFRHELTRRAVYSELLARERKVLHQSIAEAIEACYAAVLGAHTGDLARHYYQAGMWEQAMLWELRAGEQAERLYARSEALRHYTGARECALALGRGEQVAAIEQAIGGVYCARGQFIQGVARFEAALQLTVDRRRRTALKADIGTAYAHIADLRGHAFLREALGELHPDTDNHDIAVVTLWLGRYAHYFGRYGEALELLEQARALIEPSGDVSTLRFVYSFMAAARLMSAQFEQSKAWARRSIQLGEEQHYWPAATHGYLYMAENAEFEARWSHVHQAAERGRHYAQQSALDSMEMWNTLERAIAAYYQGDLGAGLELARDCIAVASGLDERRGVVHSTKVLVLLSAATGAEDEAAVVAEAALHESDRSIDLLMRCYSRLALAALCMEREDWSGAVALYRECDGLLEGTENRILMMELGAPLAEASAELGRLGDAERRIAACPELARQTGARQFEAAAGRVQAKVWLLLGRGDEAAEALDRTITLCETLGSRLELARALFLRGRLHSTLDDPGSAQIDWHRARALCLQMGARPLLWRTQAALAQLALGVRQLVEAQQAVDGARAVVEELAAAATNPATRERLLHYRDGLVLPVSQRAAHNGARARYRGLTTREREVTTLVAQGFTNRTIAETLYLSERTVTTHVSNILSKLGFNSRAQIAAWAVNTDLDAAD